MWRTLVHQSVLNFGGALVRTRCGESTFSESMQRSPSFNVMSKCVIQCFKRGVKFYWSLKIKLVEREKCFLRSARYWVFELVTSKVKQEDPLHLCTSGGIARSFGVIEYWGTGRGRVPALPNVNVPKQVNVSPWGGASLGAIRHLAIERGTRGEYSSGFEYWESFAHHQQQNHHERLNLATPLNQLEKSEYLKGFSH